MSGSRSQDADKKVSNTQIAAKSSSPEEGKESPDSRNNYIIVSEDTESDNEAKVEIPDNIKPPENKAYTDFEILGRLNSVSLHDISKAILIDNDELRTFYFKRTDQASSNSQPGYIYPLEALCASYFNLLAPNHSSNSYAVTGSGGQYLGLVSEEIPHFKSVDEDTLTDNDLAFDKMHESIFVPHYENLDDSIKNLELNIDVINRKMALQKHLEKQFESKLDNYLESNSDTNLESITSRLNIIQNKIKKYREDITKLLKEIKSLYASYEKAHNITKEKLRVYRIIKGLATGLTASYCLMEDDTHKNNISKYGQRIDFDMALFPVLYDFRPKQALDMARTPVKNATKITKKDILLFPSLVDALPNYWPTVNNKVINFINDVADYTPLNMKKKISTSHNAYTPELNNTFASLNKISIFHYHKFVTLLRFVMLKPSIYKSTARLHLRGSARSINGPILDILSKTMSSRWQGMMDCLLDLPEFYEFIRQYGSSVSEQIKLEFKERNLKFKQKELEINKRIEELETEVQKCTSFYNLIAQKASDLHNTITNLTQSFARNFANDTSVPNDMSLQLGHKSTEFDITCKEYEKQKGDLKDNLYKQDQLKKEITYLKQALLIYKQQQINIDGAERIYKNITERVNKRPDMRVTSPVLSPIDCHNIVKYQNVRQAEINNARLLFTRPPSLESEVSYEAITKVVSEGIASYADPSWINGYGFFKHHTNMAEDIRKKMQELRPKTNTQQANLCSAIQLKIYLENNKNQLPAGGMKEVLNNILQNIIWAPLDDKPGYRPGNTNRV